MFYDDPLSILFAVLILLFVGQRAGQTHSKIAVIARQMGLIAFLAVAVRMVTTGEELLPSLLQASLAGALMSAAAAVLVPLVLFVWQIGVARPYQIFAGAVRRRTDRRRERRAARRRHREERRRKRAWRREASRRQEQRGEEEVRRRHAEGARQRREDARFACLRLYDQHADQLTAKLSREDLHRYLERYLGDDNAPEVVERRAELLAETIRESVRELRPERGRFRSLSELKEHFSQQSQEIDQLDLGEDVKDSMRTAVARSEEAALRRFLQS